MYFSNAKLKYITDFCFIGFIQSCHYRTSVLQTTCCKQRVKFFKSRPTANGFSQSNHSVFLFWLYWQEFLSVKVIVKGIIRLSLLG